MRKASTATRRTRPTSASSAGTRSCRGWMNECREDTIVCEIKRGAEWSACSRWSNERGWDRVKNVAAMRRAPVGIITGGSRSCRRSASDVNTATGAAGTEILAVCRWRRVARCVPSAGGLMPCNTEPRPCQVWFRPVSQRRTNQLYFGFFIGLAPYSLVALAITPFHQPRVGVMAGRQLRRSAGRRSTAKSVQIQCTEQETPANENSNGVNQLNSRSTCAEAGGATSLPVGSIPARPMPTMRHR